MKIRDLKIIFVSIWPILALDTILYLVNYYVFSENIQLEILSSRVLTLMLIVISGFLITRKSKSLYMAFLGGIFIDMIWRPAIATLGYMLLQFQGNMIITEDIYIFFLGIIFSTLLYLPLTIFFSLLGGYFSKWLIKQD